MTDENDFEIVDETDEVSANVDEIEETEEGSEPTLGEVAMSHAVQNVIALYGFLAVLAIHNALRGFVTSQPTYGEDGSYVSAFVASPMEWLPFLLALLFSFRYYLGDLMFLRKYETKNRSFLVADALNVLLNATLIAYMSFFVIYPSELFKLMFVIMCIDIVWLWVGRLTGREKKRKGKIENSIDISIWVSIVTVTIMTIVVCILEVDWASLTDKSYLEKALSFLEQIFAGPFEETTIWWLIVALSVDTALDLVVRGPTYLGRGEPKLRREH